MARPRTLLLVLAGGAGGRLELLTDHRAKPAVPYGGSYRLIDVPLSNAHHAGIDDVWVIEQFHPVSLTDHLANGRPWDLDRTHGGLLTLHPHLGTEREGWHQGTADALWRQAPLIREFDPEHLVVVSADAVYALDYAEVVAAHAEGGGDVTMVTTHRPIEEAGRYGVVEAGEGDRITGYTLKPDEPATDLIANEVFVFRPSELLELLGTLVSEDEELKDLGHQVLPQLVDAGRARNYRFDRYWRDVGTVTAYLESHLELVGDDPAIRLDDPAWPMLTRGGYHAPSRLARGAEVADAMVAPGCEIAGRVERSVLSPGVIVEPGASVVDSVLLHGAVVRRGARVRGAVIDAGAEIGADADLGVPSENGDDDVVLVGAGARVPKGASVTAGTRLPAEKE
ncbi:glucose-1-phosphate adenylyltransferase family protein [Cryptosporangium sp. NPDC048952]|uniref:glucose-1-phosphate adenylyltransferase family protein n=1 Tax=Cryptosporangium sp. NPDC048952 TaxID=3363961 RepID=UPI0037228BD9